MSRTGQVLSGHLALLKRHLGYGVPIFDIVIRGEEHLPSSREVSLKQHKDEDLGACSGAVGRCTSKGLTEEQLVKKILPDESLLFPGAHSLARESSALLAII